MRPSLALVQVLVLLSSGIAAAEGGPRNWIENGNFREGWMGWSVTGPKGSWKIERNDEEDGFSTVMTYGRDEGEKESSLACLAIFRSNAVHRLTFRYRLSGDLEAKVRLEDVQGQGAVEERGLEASVEWKRARLDLRVPENGGYRLAFVPAFGGVGTGRFWLADVVLERLAASPAAASPLSNGP